MTSVDLSKHLRNIEASLDRIFPRNADLSWARALVGQETLPLRQECLDKINAPGWELVGRGGKRWRALVVILSHELFGGQSDEITDLSLLVELPHNGSLIVDDIEDKAETRRGGPAVHLVHGIDMAVNTGNFLYFEPTYILENSRLAESTKYQILRYFLRVMRRLHIGQGLDIQWHNENGFLPSRDEYLQMCRFKTGALSRLAAEIGAAAAEASSEEIEALGSLWEDIGVGFQVIDDVQNLTEGNPGKMRGDDIVEGKKSLPLLCHAELSSDHGASVLSLLSDVAMASSAEKEVRHLIEAVIRQLSTSGAIDEAARIGNGLLERACHRLKSDFPENQARAGMEQLLNSFFEGKSK